MGLGLGFGEGLGADRLGLPAFALLGEEVRECSDFFGEVSGEGRAETPGLSLGFGLGLLFEASSRPEPTAQKGWSLPALGSGYLAEGGAM